jgi:hypothetical protein
MKELEPLTPYPNLVQKLFSIFDPLQSSQISFQEIARTRLSPSYEYGICPCLKRLQDVNNLHLACTEIIDYAYIGRVLDSSDSCQIGSTVSTIVAEHGHYSRLIILHLLFPF